MQSVVHRKTEYLYILGKKTLKCHVLVINATSFEGGIQKYRGTKLFIGRPTSLYRLKVFKMEGDHFNSSMHSCI